MNVRLNNGMYEVVDDADYELVRVHNWTALHHRNTWYALTRVKGKTVRMHRLIFNAPPGVQVDHKDGDGLNNRRGNLRDGSNSQNQANRHRVNSNTGFKGVSRAYDNFRDRPYLAKIGRVHIGWFSTAKQAAIAYNEKAVELYGTFANLNLV